MSFRPRAAWIGLGLAIVAAAGAGEAPTQEPAGQQPSVQQPSGQADPIPYYLSRPALDTDAEGRLLARLAWAIKLSGEPLGSPVPDVSPEAREGAILADSVLSALPALGDWGPLLRAEILARVPDAEEVRRALEQLDPSLGLWSASGWRILVDALERAGDPEGAQEAALEAAAAEMSPAVEASQRLRAGQLSVAVADTARAAEDLWAALTIGDRYTSAREAAVLLDRIVGSLGEDAEVKLGRALLAASAWEPAVRRLLPQLTSDHLTSAELDELRVRLGRGLFELRRYAEAIGLLSPLAETEVVSDATADALFWTGRAALARGSVEEATGAFRRAGELAPGSTQAVEGLLLLLDRERTTGFGPKARALLDEILAAGVTTLPAESTVAQLGVESYLAGDYSTAAVVFQRYLEGSRRTAARQQAAYWSGLTQDRIGEPEGAGALWAELHAVDPFSYYGLLAGEKLGAPVIREDLARGPDPVPGIELELQNALLRLRVLRLVNIPGSLARELARLSVYFQARGNGIYDFADALAEGGFPLEGVSVGREIFRQEGEWNLRLLRIIHPFPYREVVVREARARGLDPFLVAGVIRQESLFHSPIVSSAGAVGLMQLMPPTAREVAGQLDIPYSPEALTDPETNIRLGTTYLATMTRRLGERTEDVLSAYNAGPARAREWQQTSAHGDRDVFVEEIPFQETRNYVRLVQQYARMYTALYACGDFEPCLGVSYREALALSPLSGAAADTAVR
ncbi:MAG: tetratricopeptide repeat protein [Gemmatimonadetes bacterium]|nr:tetratricopeptide repeat protein [Gemmatimonadota bacterium]